MTADYLRGLEDAARVADEWEAAYPVEVFSPDGTSIEARSAHHGRHVAKGIAADIRSLAPVEEEGVCPACFDRSSTKFPCGVCGTGRAAHGGGTCPRQSRR